MKINFSEVESNVSKKKYRFLGEGSGRVVYDLDNGYVVKIAKNAKGIAQNKAEYNISLNSQSDILAKVTSASKGFKYIIMEKADKIKNLNPVFNYFKVKNINRLRKLEVLKDFSVNHHLNYADLSIPSSWGLINGIPVVIDYGLTAEVFKKYYLTERLVIAASLLLIFPRNKSK